MDQTNKINTCKKHLNSPLDFIQTNCINQSSDKSLFYCSSCINEDLSFKGLDYILISQIANQGEKQIIQKWPPVNDISILDQLIQISANAQSHSNIEQSVINFFDNLKSEISNRIDVCQKKMIHLIKDQPIDGDSIIQKYQTISQIGELRKMLISNNQHDLYSKEQSCRQFIMSVESKKDTNTQQLQDLLNQTQKKQSLISFEFPNQVKQTILAFIDQITFFNQDHSDSQNLNQNNMNNQSIQSQPSTFSEKIMKLISNKSNFCSDQFLNEVKIKLQNLNPLLKSISFENQFQLNKSPIQFDEITIQQLEKINNQVIHLSKLQSDSAYEREVKNSESVKQLKLVLNNKMNFIENSFITEFEQRLIETYPYFTDLNVENMFTDISKLEELNNLSAQTIEQLWVLSKKMNRQNDQDNSNNTMQTLINKLKPIIHQYFMNTQSNDIESILKNYPIFELLQQPIQQNCIDIMPDLQLEKCNYSNGQQNLTINKQNNEIIVQNLTVSVFETWYNSISNIILEKDKKYVFRFQFQSQNKNLKKFIIGLMQSKDKDTQPGHQNNLSCIIKIGYDNNKNEIEMNGDCGIYKDLKGKGLKINCDNNEQLELRVFRQEQVLEVSDYPNYNYKIGVKDTYKQYLINQDDLKLYLSAGFSSSKIILKSAFIVNEFNN